MRKCFSICINVTSRPMQRDHFYFICYVSVTIQCIWHMFSWNTLVICSLFEVCVKPLTSLPVVYVSSTERASSLGQDLQKIPFKDRSWLGYKTRSRDALLSRHEGIDIAQLQLVTHMASTHSGEMWRGLWQGNDIVAKVLRMRECTVRNSRDFQEEYPRLR